jgi:hypothetical protein
MIIKSTVPIIDMYYSYYIYRLLFLDSLVMRLFCYICLMLLIPKLLKSQNLPGLLKETTN